MVTLIPLISKCIPKFCKSWKNTRPLLKSHNPWIFPTYILGPTAKSCILRRNALAPCDVNRILTAHTGFEGRRTSQSIICKSCYDFYRNLISGCSEESTDEHLQLLLSHLNTCSGNDTTTNGTIQVITQVGKQLLDNHAVLLSQVYDDFVKTSL